MMNRLSFFSIFVSIFIIGCSTDSGNKGVAVDTVDGIKMPESAAAMEDGGIIISEIGEFGKDGDGNTTYRDSRHPDRPIIWRGVWREHDIFCATLMTELGVDVVLDIARSADSVFAGKRPQLASQRRPRSQAPLQNCHFDGEDPKAAATIERNNLRQSIQTDAREGAPNFPGTQV